VLPQKLTNILTVLISLVWTANVVAGFINPELRDPMINALFALVVGSIYALGRKPGNLTDARRRLGELITGNQPAEPPEEQATDDGTGGERP